MSLLRRGRRGRRIGLVAAGALLAFQSLAIVGAQVASAATCTFAGGVLTVTSSVSETIDFQLDGAATHYILIQGTSTVPKCGAAAEATVANTTAINLIGNDTLQDVQIFMDDAAGVTRSWGTINWSVSLGANTGGDDLLEIDDSGGDAALEVTLGVSGIDLNTDGDLDATVSGAEKTWVFGSTEDDTIWGSGDTITGGPYPGKMVVYGDDETEGGDTIAGGAGDDCLNGGADVAGDDEDWADYSAATGAVIASLATGIVTAPGLGVDTLVGTAAPACEGLAGDDADGNSFEDLGGSAFNDNLTGDISAFGNDLMPGAGDDTVSGAPTTGDIGDDFIDYSDSEAGVTVDFSAGTATGNGNDTFTRIEGVYGSELDDTFIDDIESDNLFYGDSGNDTFDQGEDPASGAGDADYVDGESGTDVVDYSMRTENLAVTLDSSVDPTAGLDPCETGTEAICADGDQGDDEADDVQHVEDVNLGSGDDSFVGNAFNNAVNPGGGQNVLDGLGGSDFLDYSAYEAGVEVNLAGGSTGGDSAVSFENVRGSGFNDVIVGGDASNTIKAGGGKDNVRAGMGDDTVKGGRGNDTLRGGSGDDDLIGASGNDSLWGGGGSDFCKGGKGKDKVYQCEAGKA